MTAEGSWKNITYLSTRKMAVPWYHRTSFLMEMDCTSKEIQNVRRSVLSFSFVDTTLIAKITDKGVVLFLDHGLKLRNNPN